MTIITLFQDKIKPLKLRGTGMLNPVNTSKIDENLYAVRQDDVNFWFYKKNNIIIAIDSGYKDNKFIYDDLKNIGINNDKINYIFLTHADIDHAGGLLSKDQFGKNAKLYLHKNEEKMLLGEEKRFSIGFLKLKNPVVYKGDYSLFDDNEEFSINDINIKCFPTPGHTKGHSTFLIDNKYLFTGDSIAVNEKKGFCFFDFYNVSSKQNIESLNKLKKQLSNKKDLIVCTSHNGIHDFKKSFSNINEIAKGTKKKPFDKSAPYDVFKY